MEIILLIGATESIFLFLLLAGTISMMVGTKYPGELHHSTSMIGQGYDLGLLFPFSFVT